MREIKFRAWHKEWSPQESEFQGQKINGMEAVRDLHETKKGKWQVGMWNWKCSVPLEEVELMQFTGLLDKNGKEIYEGDIVKKQQGEYLWIYEVGTKENFGNNLYLLKRYQNFDVDEEKEAYVFRDKYFLGKESWDMLIGSDREIIGNIYENPELIRSNV